MHELTITQNILSIALDTAAEAGAARVMAIDVVVGDLSGYADASIQACFDLLSEGTPAAGAVVRIQREPAQATCTSCGHEFTVSPPTGPACPRCDERTVRLTGGDALYVASVEVEDEYVGRDRRAAPVEL